MEVRAKKQLGQHFLTDLNVARRIAATISPEALEEASRKNGGDIELAERRGSLPVVEIGPGMGVLTKFLVDDGREVTAVELDSESVGYLAREMPSLRVIEADFLRLDLATLADGGDFALIGNYPYNISSQIFFKVLDYKEKIPVVAGMLQKEVAERICAGPGSKVYGILSVLLQAWYDCSYLFSVPPGVFAPPPKVTSGVLRLTRNSRVSLGVDERDFRKVVKMAFGQRRKTLRNSLKGLLGADNPIMSTPLMDLRPERLGVEDFIEITKALPH
ncbi:MAG: 16S rRNA (adenine(1518)-N(6)/adenine(1519)-N(6))-dimethyltransferase RsmA [Muribaculaceae bacterium]|nr:16S rRNA (adenine(1518)-N(6)/adenine(1519)-N(6))-dimethyltransferase RsmA [Muribaculaceae bacterium]